MIRHLWKTGTRKKGNTEEETREYVTLEKEEKVKQKTKDKSYR